jgi:hypothetical protein
MDFFKHKATVSGYELQKVAGKLERLQDSFYALENKLTQHKVEIFKLKNPSKYNIGDSVEHGIVCDVHLNYQVMCGGTIFYSNYEYKCVKEGSDTTTTFVEAINKSEQL